MVPSLRTPPSTEQNKSHIGDIFKENPREFQERLQDAHSFTRGVDGLNGETKHTHNFSRLFRHLFRGGICTLCTQLLAVYGVRSPAQQYQSQLTAAFSQLNAVGRRSEKGLNSPRKAAGAF